MNSPSTSNTTNIIIDSQITEAATPQELRKALEATIAFDKLIDTVSARFARARLEEISDCTQEAVMLIGERLGIDRCYVFWVDREANRLGEVYDWCRDGVASLKEFFVGLPLDGFVWSLPTLRRFEPLCITQLTEIPALGAPEAQMMAANGTQAFACVPFRQGETLLGWLSLEVVERQQVWPRQFMRRLRVLADLIGHALMHYEAETALMQSEARFRAIVEDQTELICRFLPDETLTFVNEAYCRYFGKTAVQLIGHSFAPFVHEEDRALVAAQFARISPENPLVTCEHRAVLPTGEVRWHEWTNRGIYDELGQFVEYQAVGRDITQQKEAEFGLRELNRELATAVAAKDQFLANMSHELRTPLHTILLKSEMLRRGMYEALNERQHKSVAIVEESGRHLLSLINDILDLSKMNAGQETLTIVPIDAQLLCHAALQLVQQLAQEKQHKLFLNIDQDVDLFQGDELRLKQVLVNLLSNSVKFTPNGGRIGLDVLGDLEQEIIQFVVWDTGVGISPQEQARIFEPFAQVDDDFQRGAGTGLGLALVKSLVALHGGTIEVESTVGKGSRFTILLPWRVPEPVDVGLREAETAVSAPQDRFKNAEERLLLLAEDNETLVETLIDFFELMPFEIVVASNGLQVLDMLEQRVPDIILMDVQMPFLNGLETTKRIRANDRFAHIPVVMVTAMAMPGDEERCFEAGATAYLSKPLNLMQLMDTIEAQLAM